MSSIIDYVFDDRFVAPCVIPNETRNGVAVTGRNRNEATCKPIACLSEAGERSVAQVAYTV